MDNAGQGQGDRTVRGKSEAPLSLVGWVSGLVPDGAIKTAWFVPNPQFFAGGDFAGEIAGR